MTMQKNPLLLRVKKEYFDQIKSGEKTEEYRETTDYWWSRIANKDFPSILIVNGMQMKNPSKVLEFPWKGYVVRKIVHPFFGPGQVEVFAIKLERDK